MRWVMVGDGVAAGVAEKICPSSGSTQEERLQIRNAADDHDAYPGTAEGCCWTFVAELLLQFMTLLVIVVIVQLKFTLLSYNCCQRLGVYGCHAAVVMCCRCAAGCGSPLPAMMLKCCHDTNSCDTMLLGEVLYSCCRCYAAGCDAIFFIAFFYLGVLDRQPL